MRKMFLCYDEDECKTVFWDSNNKIITTIHENDGEWRTEYMNKIPNHFGVEVIRVNKLPKAIKKQFS